MRVGFLPVVPHPVTDYATVRKSLTNFQCSRQQLNQEIMPVVSDEGVFHIVVDIVMTEPQQFCDLYPMLGAFHMAKVLLRCAGRYLSGSGLDDALIEAEVFGKKTLVSVLSGGHYVRSFQGMLILSEMITALAWQAFWGSNEQDLPQSVVDLKHALMDKRREACVEKFVAVVEDCVDLRAQFETFFHECQSKSELCQYLSVFQQIVSVIKQLIAADRDGNWPLHVGTVRSAMPILREFDAINYLRYGSWYLERIQVLEKEHPALYDRFLRGFFVVRDRADAVFAAVSGDMKLEQSINRFSQGPGGHVIVGSSGDASIVAEFDLLYHEILAIHNLLQQLTNSRVMDHLETTVQHELIGRKGLIFDQNVVRLLDFVKARGNPFCSLIPHVSLHNLVTKSLVPDNIKVRILKALEHGEEAYQLMRNERYKEKQKKLSVTISKVKLPTFNSKCEATSAPHMKAVVTSKDIAMAERDIEVAVMRGMSQDEIYSHDLLNASSLFTGDITTKPDKSQLVAEVEQNLDKDDYNFNKESPLVTHVLVDFMSKIRQFTNLQLFQNFGDAINCVLWSCSRMFPSVMTHVIFDSYMELSTKEGERMRRAGEGGSIDLAKMTESVPIPQQMDKFLSSSPNKQSLQLLTRDVAVVI